LLKEIVQLILIDEVLQNQNYVSYSITLKIFGVKWIICLVCTILLFLHPKKNTDRPSSAPDSFWASLSWDHGQNLHVRDLTGEWYKYRVPRAAINLQEAAERCKTGPRANHDNWHWRISG
jgi:hypothetical protein